MYFHLTGIKDISEKNYTLDLLIESEDVSSVKKFLSEQKVIILGLEHYNAEPQSFGNIYVDIEGGPGTFRVVGHIEKIEEFILYIIQLNLKVIDANYFSNPLAKDEIQRIIQNVEQQYQRIEQQLLEEKGKKEKKNTIKFNDKKLKKAYEAIDQIINQIDQLLSIGGKNILPNTLKKFDDMRGGISKLRLATNYDKIIEELYKAMNLIVETQDFLLEKLEADKIFPVVPQSVVTNIEVIREQTRLAKANLLSVLGANLSKEETMYATLGYIKLFTKYLHKDIQVVVENKLLFVQKIFRGCELALLFLLLEFAILSVFGNSLGIDLSLQKFGIAFIYIAIAALLFRVVNEYLHPKKLLHYAGIAVLMTIIYVLIVMFVKIILVF